MSVSGGGGGSNVDLYKPVFSLPSFVAMVNGTNNLTACQQRIMFILNMESLNVYTEYKILFQKL